jgi:DNA modification methylase
MAKKTQSTTAKDLKPSSYNPRTIAGNNLKGLALSLEIFGDLSGIVWNKKTGKLISGHQRQKAIKDFEGAKIKWQPETTITLGEEENRFKSRERAGTLTTPSGQTYSIRQVNWKEDFEKAANLAANNPNLQGEFVQADVERLLEELEASRSQLVLQARIDQLTKEIKSRSGKTPDDQLPGGGKGKLASKAGKIYQLGNHRLLCGDATEEEAIEDLMSGKKAAMVHTDPPYGVKYDSQAHGGKFEMIKNDDKMDNDLVNLLAPAFSNAAKHTDRNGAWYVWHASSARQDFTFAMRTVAIIERQYLIWVKPSSTLGWSHYQQQHEPCFYAAREDAKIKWYGNRQQMTIWRAALKTKKELATVVGSGIQVSNMEDGSHIYIVKKPPKNKKARNYRLEEGQSLLLTSDQEGGDAWEVAWETGHRGGHEHPNQKPVELAERAINNSSRAGEIVLDLFLGSGTTLIAAEKLGRICYGAELDPKYCDLIRRRWAEFVHGEGANWKQLTPEVK